MIPCSSDFLKTYDWRSMESSHEVSPGEKQLLMSLLRLFFGPAIIAGQVKDVSEPNSLAQLATTMHQQGERFQLLEEQTSLHSGYFQAPYQTGPQEGIYIAFKDNMAEAPSYFIYEKKENLIIYIGPDFLHGEASSTVVNCLSLNASFEPTSSHTLRFI